MLLGLANVAGGGCFQGDHGPQNDCPLSRSTRRSGWMEQRRRWRLYEARWQSPASVASAGSTARGERGLVCENQDTWSGARCQTRGWSEGPGFIRTPSGQRARRCPWPSGILRRPVHPSGSVPAGRPRRTLSLRRHFAAGLSPNSQTPCLPGTPPSWTSGRGTCGSPRPFEVRHPPRPGSSGRAHTPRSGRGRMAVRDAPPYRAGASGSPSIRRPSPSSSATPRVRSSIEPWPAAGDGQPYDPHQRLRRFPLSLPARTARTGRSAAAAISLVPIVGRVRPDSPTRRARVVTHDQIVHPVRGQDLF